MRSRSILISLVAGIAQALASASAQEAPVITNFKFGLICGPNENRRVCFQTDVIQVTNESICKYNQQLTRCTWYGLSYDYDVAADTKIDCEYQTDKVVALGNPKEALTPSQVVKFDMTLKQGRHHFFLAQYMTGERGSDSPGRAVESCSYAGMPVFSKSFQFEFVEVASAVESVPDMNSSR